MPWSAGRDVIIVASVSSIYGLGSPDDYKDMMVALRRGDTIDRDVLLMKLVDIQYDRNDVSFERSKFRVRGDCVEVWPSYEQFAVRIELWGDEIDQLSIINATSGEVIAQQDELFIYPAKHFVLPDERIKAALEEIRNELNERLEVLRRAGKLLEAQRLSARTRFDLEMMQEVGYCPGIENYSRPLSGRPSGAPPHTLYSYFPQDFLLIVDESHVTVSPDSSHVCRRSQPQGKRWSNTDSGCPAHSITVPLCSKNGSSASLRRSL